MRKVIVLVFLIASTISPALASSLPTDALNFPGNNLIDKYEIRITHRFYGKLTDPDYGIDFGANVSMGFGARILPNLDLFASRTGFLKEYMLATKLKLSDDLSLGLGASRKTDTTVTNNNSVYAQLIYTKELFANKFYLSFIPAYATGTDLVNATPVFDNTVAFGTSVVFILPVNYEYFENAQFSAEYMPTISGYHKKNPYLAIGAAVKTWGHFFHIFVANTVDSTPSTYIVGSDASDLYLGFNIIRKF